MSVHDGPNAKPTSEKTTRGHLNKDRWVSSACGMCLHGCGIKVRVKDGLAVEIKGDETNPSNCGRLCPKGQAGLQRLYDPYRIKAPLMRTNPDKGPGADPRWKEISWEKAFDIITEKLARIRQSDPRKLLFADGDFQRSFSSRTWPVVFGSPNLFTSLGGYCGAAYHPMNGTTQASFAAINDYSHCQYWIQFGSGDGFSSHIQFTSAARRMADARARGMRVVVVEPHLSVAASKADEWVPIRPGTDRALALAMINVLVNELGIYDEAILRATTNAPYLVGDDGYCVRSPDTQKPMVWDAAKGQAVPFDAPGSTNAALEGRYVAAGKACQPAFQILKDQVKQYTPEAMSEVTTVPVDTIRRLAKELGEAARIGSTITLDGRQYPYRPAAVNYYRGAQAHKDGLMDNMTFKLINMLLGNIAVPGGHLGVPLNHMGLLIEPGPDGMITPQHHIGHLPHKFKYPPDSTLLTEYFPVGFWAGHLNAVTFMEPEKYGLNYRPEALIISHSNPVWNMPGTGRIRKILEQLDFIVAIDIVLNESAHYADVVLPDRTYLESYVMVCLEPLMVTNHAIRQPVVEPLHNTMDTTDILTELADRLGFIDDWNHWLNFRLGLLDKPALMLNAGKKYAVEEIMDRFARSLYGEERGLEWFKEHGHLVRPNTLEEMYQPYGRWRIPFYFEFFKRTGDELKRNLEPHGVSWDYSNFLPLPVWRPGPIHSAPSDYDLYAVSFKSARHTFADTVAVPWLKEVSERVRWESAVLIHPETAAARDIKNGDRILIQSAEGQIRAVAYLTEGIHPEVIAFPNLVTRWGGHPSAKGPGSHLNELLCPSLDYTDGASGAIETCARVKVTKEPSQPAAG